jgi:hypothetical protein
MRRLLSILVLLAIFLAIVGALALRHRTVAISLFRSDRIPLPAGPYGALIHSVDEVKFRATATLNPGRYTLSRGTNSLTLSISSATQLTADADAHIVQTAASGKQFWITPKIGRARIDFSEPITVGAKMHTAVRSIQIRSEHGLTGDVEPDYAQTISMLLLGLLFGPAASAPDTDITQLVANVQVESASLGLRPGATVAIANSQLVCKPGSSAELHNVQLDLHGCAKGEFSLHLGLAEPTEINLSDIVLRPHAADVDVTGSFHVEPDTTTVSLARGTKPSTISVDGGSLKLAEQLAIPLSHLSLTMKEIHAQFITQSESMIGTITGQQLRLELAKGSSLRLGNSTLVLGDDSELTADNLAVGGDRVKGTLLASFNLTAGTQFDVQGLQVRPKSGAVRLPIDFTYTAAGHRLDFKGGNVASGDHITLSDSDLKLGGSAPASIQFARLGATMKSWSLALGKQAADTASALRIVAVADGGALRMPLANGSLSIDGIRLPAIDGKFRRAAGNDFFHCEFGSGVHFGKSQWSFETKDRRVDINSGGFDAEIASIETGWRDIQLNLTSVGIRPTSVVSDEAANWSFTIEMPDKARLIPSGQFFLTPNEPSRSVIPKMSYAGRIAKAVARYGDTTIGLGDADATFAFMPDGGLNVEGSLKGKLVADGLPAGINELVKKGELKLDDLAIPLGASATTPSLGRLELRLPRDDVIAQIRELLSQPIQFDDKQLPGEIPEVVKDFTASHVQANVAIVSLTFAGDTAMFDAKAHVDGELDGRNKYRAVKWEIRTVAKVFGREIKTKVPVYEEHWTGLEKLSGFSGALSGRGQCRLLTTGGGPLNALRLKAEVKCDQLHLDDLHINNDVLNVVVQGIRALFGGEIDAKIREGLSRTVDLPDPFAHASAEGRAWLARFTLDSIAIDADGSDLVITAVAAFR